MLSLGAWRPLGTLECVPWLEQNVSKYATAAPRAMPRGSCNLSTIDGLRLRV